MRKKLSAVVVAVLAFGMISASAATMGVNSSDLGAGVDTTAACDGDGVTVGNWTTAYSQVDNEFRITGYTVSGIDAACDTLGISIELVDSGNASLDAQTGTVSGTSYAVTGIDESAASVEGVAVVIAG